MNKSSYHIYSGRVIYAYTLPDEGHKGFVKITDRLLTLTENDMKALEENPETLEEFVDLPEGVKIEKAWNGTFKDAASGKWYLVSARDIYDYLENSGVNFKYFHKDNTTQEETDRWFKASLEDVDNAINMIRQNLTEVSTVEKARTIHFRPEQKKAIEETTTYLKNGGRRFLWNAKMRFGKTLSALEVARRMGYKFTLIVTHRPVVNDGWKKDFDIIFKDSGYEYGAIVDKNAKESEYFKKLIKNVESGDSAGLVFFVSIQYLRLSHLVKPSSEAKNKAYKENKEKTAILNFPWDFVVIDEAHEGTQSERGVEVMRYLRLNVPENEEKQPELTIGIDAISRKKENREDHTSSEDQESKKVEKLPVSPRSWKTMHSDEDPITLSLSGTPFNLYTEFSPKEIYTWDYVKEQTAKENWSKDHYDDPNPYDVLPRMHIFNLDIEETIGRQILEPGDSETKENSEKAITDEELDEEFSGFNFSRLFKVWDKKLCEKFGKETDLIGKFVHEEELMEFFYALARETTEGSNFPFSTPEFRKAFRHTFWLIPGVAEGKVLQELLEKPEWTVGGKTVINPYKRNFRVINEAGNEHEDLTGNALKNVEDHIMLTTGKMPKGPWDEKPLAKLKKSDREKYENYREKLVDWDGKYTITLSCGKLTTGVSVPEWTAVFYMKGNDATSASSYMQTIFRTQTPAVVNGVQKTDCYVFDFSPTRSLKVFSDAVRLYMASERGNDRSEKYTRDDQKEEMKKWLALMPLQAINVAKPGDEKTLMEEYEADKLFSQLDEKLINRVVRSGYADNSIYDSVAIMEISDDAAARLGEISKKVKGDKTSTVEAGIIQTGPNTPGKPSGKTRRLAQEAAGKSDKELSPEEIEAKKAVDAYNRQRRERMKTMRAISIRIPLLMYGAEINNEDELNIENFTKLVDDESWAEFMPPYITKEDFDMVRACYDPVRFRGAAERILEYAEKADTRSKTERVKEIARIFSFFRNPDKETVLTPWRVVNMHMSQTLGGYNFFDDNFKERRKGEPEFVNQGKVTLETLATDKSKSVEERNIELDKRHILEINSKTGLYPLYVAYSLFRDRKEIYESAEVSDRTRKDDNDIWEETLRDNIFVVCKTPMAKSITRRTLAGFMTSKVNGVDTGRPLQVNAVCPEWELSKKDLVKKKILKNPEGIEIPEDEKHNSDLVTALRYDSSLFEKDVVKPKWWERGGHEERQKDETVHIKLDKLSVKDMINFNAVVGNPPYQLNNEGDGKGSDPLYHLFIDSGRRIGIRGTLITPGRFLFNAGKTPSEWNKKMLNDEHFKIVKYYENGRYIFDTVDIKGGIAISFWDRLQSFAKIGTFLKYEEINSILKKVDDKIKLSENNFSKRVFPREQYKFNELLYIENPSLNNRQSQGHRYSIGSNIFDLMPEIFEENQKDNFYKIYGRKNSRRCSYYIPAKYVEVSDNDNIDSYKVIIAQANGGGKFGEALSQPFIAEKNSFQNDTFISIGKFNTYKEAEHCLKYISGKFARFFLSILKVTQSTSKECWEKVPNIDNELYNDIDWSKSIAEIDQQLYKKYGLDKNEIKFIESMIKPME